MNTTDHFFDEPDEPGDKEQSRQLASEVIRRVFLWAADAKTLDECGYRTFVALACVCPDLFEGATLEDLGFRAGRQRQAIWKLQREFRQASGI